MPRWMLWAFAALVTVSLVIPFTMSYRSERESEMRVSKCAKAGGYLVKVVGGPSVCAPLNVIPSGE